MDQKIGICGPSELIHALAAIPELHVIGAPSFREAVGLFRGAETPIPVIIADREAINGISAWVDNYSRRADVRVIPGDGGVFDGHPLTIAVPILLSDLLASFGLFPHIAHDVTLVHGGAVEAPTDVPPAPEDTLPVTPAVETDLPAPAVSVVPLPPAAVTLPAPVPEATLPAPAAMATLPAPEAVPPAPATEVTPAPVQVTEPVLPQPAPLPPAAAAILPAPAPQPHVALPEPAAFQPAPVAASVAPAATPVALQPVQPVQPATIEHFFDRHSHHATHAIQHSAHGNILITWAAKGGVGKTTISLLAAGLAAEHGLRVALIDANRGQANAGHYLRIKNQPFPTIHNAREHGWEAAITSAHQLTTARGFRGPVGFDLIQGPPEHLASPTHTPATLYAEVTTHLKTHYDLIIIDTQIAEAHFTDLWDQLIVPEIRSGAWALGLADKSPSGLPDLLTILRKLVTELHLPPGRLLTAMNRWPDFEEEDTVFLTQQLTGLATFIGAAQDDPQLHDQILAGFLPTSGHAAAPIVNAALHHITGNPAFQHTPTTRRRRTLFRKRG